MKTAQSSRKPAALFSALVLSVIAISFPAIQVGAGEHESGGRRAAMAIEIKFGSIGSGIDGRTLHAVNALVEQLTEQGSIELKTEKHWGREGELTLCVQFSSYAAYRERAPELTAIVIEGNEKLGREQTFYQSKLNCTGQAPRPNE